MSTRAVLLVLAVGACSAQTQSETDVPDLEVPTQTLLTLEELPPMPDYPRPRGGHLVVVSDGDFAIGKVWEVEAGACASAHEIELYAEDDSSGTIIVLYYPDGNPEGSYPIIMVDSAVVGERAALVGVQIFQQQRAFGFQAIEGSLELQAVNEELTGRFASTVQEVQDNILTRYVGVFSGVGLRELSDEYCSSLDVTPRPLGGEPTVRRY
ncbi:MAG: hypothetical protein JSW71_20320 [Gemmatimonadota bacterium]|nr:MAG: hypothetical protein JSW71_20320 [Gemmatimonadota bacterium]